MKNIIQKLLYWIPNGLLLLMMMSSGIMYFVQHDVSAQIFIDLGYPVYSMYFNAIAKILGGIAILTPVPRFLKEWAYAGYLFIILLAIQAVWMTMPLAEGWFMIFFFILWALAYWQFKRRG